MAKPELAVVEVQTEEQAAALKGLHAAMESFFGAVVACDNAGIPLADAFTAIGVEIPRMMQPMVNALTSKLPGKDGIVTIDT